MASLQETLLAKLREAEQLVAEIQTLPQESEEGRYTVRQDQVTNHRQWCQYETSSNDGIPCTTAVEVISSRENSSSQVTAGLKARQHFTLWDQECVFLTAFGWFFCV